MQGQLGRLYDVDVEHDVRDYLVTDRALLATLTAGNPGRSADEQLIVVENGGAVDVALYLDQGVLERLVAADPRHGISGANLADFWTVLEGVSHFHYLAWNAGFDKPVTLLELEMQAEVDKYVSTRMLLQAQPRGHARCPAVEATVRRAGARSRARGRGDRPVSGSKCPGRPLLRRPGEPLSGCHLHAGFAARAADLLSPAADGQDRPHPVPRFRLTAGIR